ncbi:peptidylprolyl isomerase [bacterium]|nr:peptidylprolyl isomerase [bacterium]
MSKRIISFHYTLKDPQGQPLQSSRGQEPLSYLEGVGQIIPGLEAEVNGLQVGDQRTIEIKAAQAYGMPNPDNIVEVPREKFGDHPVKLGDRLRLGGDQQAMSVTVTKMSDTHITLDGNHPLAGQDLTFDVEMTTVREATPEEIEHGHAACAGCSGDCEEHCH